MRGFRNFLIHEYFGVSPRRLWDTARNDIPALARSPRAILEAAK